MTLEPPDPRLSDGVIELRPWMDDDVPAITAACKDPEISKWIPVVPSPYTEDDAREYLALTKTWWSEGAAATFAITAGGEPLGSIGIHLNVGEGRAAIGYWLARKARGHGYTTRALRLVSRWALEQLGLERLQLIAEPENAASCVVAEKAGFRREGVLRSYMPTPQRGRRDVAMYSLLPGELRAD